MTQICLIRHGESEANAGTGLVGDSLLTPRGIAQAERLRDRLAATGELAPDVLISSPLRRARHTAEIVAPVLGQPVCLDDDLVERRVGAASGLPTDMVRSLWPTPDYAADPRAPWAPESENVFTFQARVSEALARLCAEHAGHSIVIVCHAGVISAAMLFFQGLDTVTCAMGTVYALPEYRDLVGRQWLPAYATTNTSLTRWRRAERRGTGHAIWFLDAFNDTAHLHDVAGSAGHTVHEPAAAAAL
jgi:probable phosphoglycerate mutase